MHIVFQHILDFIFPPSNEEIRLRSISPSDFYSDYIKLPQTEFPFIKSIFSYKNPIVKELVWQIKYKKDKHCLKIAGYALYNQLKENLSESITLIPIPISKSRRKERGYNQAELIIDEILKHDTNHQIKKDFNLLIRTKDIEKQTHKNRNDRISNTANIFQVTQTYNTSNKIIIIDDVSTTGSTIREAREHLMKAGYVDVRGLTIAH
jgi:ComF family protein